MSSSRKSLKALFRRISCGLVFSGTVTLAQAYDGSGPELPKSVLQNYREDSNYGPEEALLNPIFKEDGKVELGVGAAYSPFSSLIQYEAASALLDYHFNRRHAIEPLYIQYNWAQLSNFTTSQITDKISASKSTSTTVEVPNYTYAFSYLFTPYYAKMHITEKSVVHFDVFFGAGFALLSTKDIYLNNTAGGSQMRPGAAFVGGLRFMIPDQLAIRAELRDFVHSEDDFGNTTTAQSLQISLSTSLFFSAF